MAGCCESIVKTIMFIFNFIIWLAGLAILIIGIVVAVNNPFKSYFTITVNFNESYWVVVLVIVFVTAAILVGIGFLGCCGACKENSCMLKTYGLVLIFIIVLEIIGIIIIGVFHDDIEANLQKNMLNQTTTTYYNETSLDGMSVAWNKMMIDLNCCGAFNYKDWKTSKYVSLYPSNPVPYTCCRWNSDTDQPYNISSCYADASGYVNPDNGTYTDLYAQGCFTAIENVLLQNKVIVIAILAAVAGALLLGIIASCCLAKSYSGSETYA